MKRLALLLAVPLLGCTTVERGPPSAQWLVGVWLMLEPDLVFPIACASGLPIAYDADGRYSLFEESGTWRLEGDRLIETPTEANEDVIDPTEVPIGQPAVSRIRRVGRDAFRKTYADGSVETFRRCPPA